VKYLSSVSFAGDREYVRKGIGIFTPLSLRNHGKHCTVVPKGKPIQRKKKTKYYLVNGKNKWALKIRRELVHKLPSFTTRNDAKGGNTKIISHFYPYKMLYSIMIHKVQCPFPFSQLQ
jgi:hypothetical protein